MIARGEISKFRKILIFEYNYAPNCCTVKNSYLRGLDLNIEKVLLAILIFSTERGKIAKFEKQDFRT